MHFEHFLEIHGIEYFQLCQQSDFYHTLCLSKKIYQKHKSCLCYFKVNVQNLSYLKHILKLKSRISNPLHIRTHINYSRMLLNILPDPNMSIDYVEEMRINNYIYSGQMRMGRANGEGVLIFENQIAYNFIRDYLNIDIYINKLHETKIHGILKDGILNKVYLAYGLNWSSYPLLKNADNMQLMELQFSSKMFIREHDYFVKVAYQYEYESGNLRRIFFLDMEHTCFALYDGKMSSIGLDGYDGTLYLKNDQKIIITQEYTLQRAISESELRFKPTNMTFLENGLSVKFQNNTSFLFPCNVRLGGSQLVLVGIY